MAGGLVGSGRAYKTQAINALNDVYERQEKRERFNENLERQQDIAQQQQQGTLTGAGASLGFAVGGPIGALVGGALGFLSSEIF